MTTAMYDAREAIIPGSVYDRSSQGESLQGTGPAPQLLTVPTPTASSPVTPGVASQALVHRSLFDRVFSASLVRNQIIGLWPFLKTRCF